MNKWLKCRVRGFFQCNLCGCAVAQGQEYYGEDEDGCSDELQALLDRHGLHHEWQRQMSGEGMLIVQRYKCQPNVPAMCALCKGDHGTPLAWAEGWIEEEKCVRRFLAST
jgi:hypothetical protein